MKQIDLTVDLRKEGISLGETAEADVFPMLFAQMFDTANPQGLSFRDGHRAYKILTKLEVIGGVGVLELEDDEFEFVRDAATRGRFSIQQNKVAHIIYGLLGLL